MTSEPPDRSLDEKIVATFNQLETAHHGGLNATNAAEITDFGAMSEYERDSLNTQLLRKLDLYVELCREYRQ